MKHQDRLKKKKSQKSEVTTHQTTNNKINIKNLLCHSWRINPTLEP